MAGEDLDESDRSGGRAARWRPPPARTGATCWAGLALALGAGGCDAQVDPAYVGEPLMTIQGRVEAPRGVGEIAVGLLWFRPAGAPLDAAVECTIERSGEAPGACAAACGTPSCDDLARLEAWEDCASQCAGPTGVSLIRVEADATRLFDGAVGETTPVQGTFPSLFELALLLPPPDTAISRASTGERLAIALFVALDPAGAPFELDLGALPSFPPWLLGGSGSHVLMFAPDGVSSASQWGTLLEVELEPGFRLVEVVEVEPSSDGDEDVEEEEGTAFRPVRTPGAAEVQLTVGDPSMIDWPLRAGMDEASR